MSSPHADADDIIVTAGTNTLQLADNEMTQEIVDHIKMVGKKSITSRWSGRRWSHSSAW